MPDLLEVIAENDTSVLKGWAAVVTARATQLASLPAREKQREWLTLAREFTRHSAWAAETAEGWLARLISGVREGINGHEFRIHYRSGRTVCQMCLTIVELGSDLWAQVEAHDATKGEVQDARALLSAAKHRVLAVDAEFNRFAPHAQRKLPEVDPALIEKGKKQIEEGKGLTREQALAAVRKSQ
jgi:hypothetical protein